MADEVERDRIEGDFTRGGVEKIWCFCSKPRGVCIKTKKKDRLPDEEALNPLFALAYSFVSLPLQILDAINPRASVQPVREDLKTLNLGSNELKKIPGSIVKLEGLEIVDISENLFKRFPAAVTTLPQLRVLRVTSNAVRNVSPKVGHMNMLRELWLDKNRIEQLPVAFGQLKGLVILSLSDNAFSEFPEVVCRCANLQELWIEHNNLVTVPNCIDELKALQLLALGINAFQKMPYSLSQLRELKDLRLGRNQINQLMTATKLKGSNSDGGVEKELKVEPFKMMVNLESLHLGVNRITQLPPDLWKTPILVELNLRGNRLETLSDKIERLKQTLERLYLDDNKLQELPNCFSQFLRLQELTVSGNELAKIPPLPTTITQLLVRNNHLTRLPHTLLECTNLEELDIRDNSLTDVPPYLLRDDEIAEYLHQWTGSSQSKKKGTRKGTSRGRSAIESKLEASEAGLSASSDNRSRKSSLKAERSRNTGVSRRTQDQARINLQADTSVLQSNESAARSTRTAAWVAQDASSEVDEEQCDIEKGTLPARTVTCDFDVKNISSKAKRYTGRSRGTKPDGQAEAPSKGREIDAVEDSRAAQAKRISAVRGKFKRAVNTVRATNAVSDSKRRTARRTRKGTRTNV